MGKPTRAVRRVTALVGDAGGDALEKRRRDIALLATVPVLLGLVHVVVPASLRTALVLDHTAVDPLSLVTASYLHASTAHLGGNVLGYVVAVSGGYWLAVARGVRPWYLRSVAALLLVGPVLISLTSVAAFGALPPTPPSAQGFSGIVGGLAGIVLVSLAAALGDEFDSVVGGALGNAMLLLLLDLVGLRLGDRLQLGTIGLSVVGFTIIGIQLQRHEAFSFDRATVGRVTEALGLPGLFAAGALVSLVLALFPAGPLVVDGTFTNVFGHAAGVLWGGLISVGVSVVSE